MTKCSKSLTKHIQDTTVTDETKCSKSLTKHIRLLKDETNRLITLKRNNFEITTTELNEFLKHQRYVKEQLKIEKFKAFNDTLTK